MNYSETHTNQPVVRGQKNSTEGSMIGGRGEGEKASKVGS